MISTDKTSSTAREFPLDGPINLSVRLGQGSVTVDAVDGLTTASVTLTPRPGAEDHVKQIAVEMSGPTLTVHAPRSGGVFDLFSERRRGPAIDAVIRVPSGTALRIATFTADITVTGRCGGADVATGMGRVEAAHVDGDLRLRIGSAIASVDEVGGSVVLRSGHGNARFGTVGGALQSGCGSGRLDAGSVLGAVKARTGSGELHLAAVHGDVDLSSGTGAMSVGLPAGVTARLDIQTGRGSVSSDLPVEDAPADPTGAITVRARTGTGDIRLFRAG